MPLLLKYKGQTSVPVEVEGLTPQRVRELSLPAIEKHIIYHGNREVPLAELFDVSGHASDERLEFVGNLSGVHWIGAGMSGGEIRVAGSAGRHVGSEMTGGEIHVSGDASDWLGGEMHGGLIHVRGRAGHLVGAAYRGSARGMTGGTILVDGDAGDELGHTMRRGLVAIGGNGGDFAGFNMIAGTVLIAGTSGIRHGANMKRGTIALLGDAPQMLPTFRRGGLGHPVFLRMLLLNLTRWGFPVTEEMLARQYQAHHGDFLTIGKGEIFTR